jgi:hypothetical protein
VRVAFVAHVLVGPKRTSLTHPNENP